jgi:hypothetical protein
MVPVAGVIGLVVVVVEVAVAPLARVYENEVLLITVQANAPLYAS